MPDPGAGPIKTRTRRGPRPSPTGARTRNPAPQGRRISKPAGAPAQHADDDLAAGAVDAVLRARRPAVLNGPEVTLVGPPRRLDPPRLLRELLAVSPSRPGHGPAARADRASRTLRVGRGEREGQRLRIGAGAKRIAVTDGLLEADADQVVGLLGRPRPSAWSARKEPPTGA